MVKWQNCLNTRLEGRIVGKTHLEDHNHPTVRVWPRASPIFTFTESLPCKGNVSVTIYTIKTNEAEMNGGWGSTFQKINQYGKKALQTGSWDKVKHGLLSNIHSGWISLWRLWLVHSIKIYDYWNEYSKALYVCTAHCPTPPFTKTSAHQ